MQNEKFETFHVETEFSNSHYDFVTVTIAFPNCFKQILYEVIINDADKLCKPTFYFNKRSLANIFIRHYKGRHSLRFWTKLYQLNSQYHYEYIIQLLHDFSLSMVKIDSPILTSDKLKFEKFHEFISDKIRDVQIKCDENGNYYFAFVPNEN